MSSSRFIKCVTVGDGDVGKTCQDDYSRPRPLSYVGADVFILAFSLTSKANYENVSTKLSVDPSCVGCSDNSCRKIGQLGFYFPCPDFREDKQFLERPGAVPITHAQGEELKRFIGAPFTQNAVRGHNM